MSRLMCHLCRDSRQWRARRDSNPRPSDPKSASRRGKQREPIRAWNGHRADAVLVDSGVSLDPAPKRVFVPSSELERVRCLRRLRSTSNAHDETQGLYAWMAEAFAAQTIS